MSRGKTSSSKKSRSKSSNRWLKEHFDDVYVRQAQEHGYRARSAFKLVEIAEKYPIFKNVQTVVDLGCAPGGWCQVALEQIKGQDIYLAGLDLLPIEPIEGVQFIQGDFLEDSVLEQLLERVGGRKIDLVLCDIAPNFSGVNAVDQPKSIYLCELALDFCHQVMQKNGAFVVKLFQGEGFDQYIQDLKMGYGQVIIYKPKASRPRSREVYAVAMGYK